MTDIRSYISRAAAGISLSTTIVIVAAEIVGNSDGLEHTAAHVGAGAIAVWIVCRLSRRWP